MDNEITELKSALETLCQEFNKRWPLEDAYSDRLDFRIFGGSIPLVSMLPEYGITLMHLNKVPFIKTHIDKLVGASASLMRMTDVDYLNRFLVWQGQDRLKRERKGFERCFEEFIKFFKTDEIEWCEQIVLFNFDSDVPEIDLGGGFKIRRMSLDEQLKYNSEYMRHSGRMGLKFVTKSNFLIEVKTMWKKRIVDPSTCGNDEEYLKKFSQIQDNVVQTIDRIVSMLRLLRSSAFYKDNVTYNTPEGFYSAIGASYWGSKFEPIIVGDTLKISELDVKEVIGLWNKYDGKNDRIDRALRRLSLAGERHTVADAVVDVFIGLETLYLRKQEQSLALKLRVARTLASDVGSRKGIFDFLTHMYRIRNDLVHGKQMNAEPKDVVRLQDILRDSIKRNILQPEQFSDAHLDAVLLS